MVTVLNEYDQRKCDINNCYGLLDDLMEREGDIIFNSNIVTIKHVSSDIKAILRSAFFLMLYNCVESTVTNCIEAICKSITSEECTYSSLNEDLKMLLIEAYEYNVKKEFNQKKDHIIATQKSLDVLFFNAPIVISINDCIHTSSERTYSGSLDTREVKKIFMKFGINMDDLSCNPLQKIKDNRNKLAHGDVSFQECSNDSPIQYLEEIKDKMFSFFDKVIERVKEYIDDKRYLAT